MSKKKLTIITILSIAILTCSYFVAANYGFFSGGTNAPSVSADTMTRGLVGYWEFDEGTGQTAYDASDNGNDGTLGADANAGSDDPKWTANGKNAGAMEFDGVDDYVGIGDTSEGTVELTISVWLYRKNYDTFDGIISHTNGVSATDGWWLTAILNDTISFSFADADFNSASFGLPLETWTYVTVTFSDADDAVKFYKNGNFVENIVATQSITESASDLRIGLEGSSYGDQYFNGSIDSVRIYNRALSADEVRYHYNRGGPVGSWNFDEGSGTTAFDSTENNNDGTLKSSGLDFDGVNDYVDAGNNVSLEFATTSFTVMAWVKTSLQPNGHIVFYGDTADEWYSLSIGVSGPGIVIDDDATKTECYATYTANDSNWHHYVGVRDITNDKLYIYIDGILKNNVVDSSGNISNPNYKTVYVGRKTAAGVGSEYFNGSIDEVRIYNTALSAEEIDRQYNNDFSQDPTGNLVLLQHFEEGMACNANDEAGCLTDDSSETNNGTLYNFDNLTTYDNGTDGWITTVKKPEWRWVNGKYKTAGEFNGWDDYVSLSEISQTQTVSGWTKNSSGEWNHHTSLNESNAYETKETTYLNGIESNFYETWKDETVQASSDVYAIFDSQDESASYANEYTLGTAIDEGATHKITFTATDRYMSGMYVYITDKGTGNWIAYLHTSVDSLLSQSGNGSTTPVGLNANLSVGWYFFPLPVALTVGNTYHIHLKSSVADGKVKSNVTGDFSTASYKLTYANKTKSITVTSGGEDLTLYSNDSADGLLHGSTIDLDAGTFVYDPSVNGSGSINGGHCDIYEPVDKKYFMLHGAGEYDIYLSSSYLTYKVNTILPALTVKVKGPSTSAGRFYNVQYSFDNSNWTTFITDTDTSGAEGTFNAQRHNVFYIKINHVSGGAKYIGGTFDVKANLDLSGIPFVSGKLGLQSGGYFNGTIDDVRIYDYARTADEIRLDYQAGMATHLGPSGKDCDDDPAGCMDYGLVGSWGMDEGAGTMAYDSSDNSNDGSLGAGTFSNMPKWTTDSPPFQGGAGGGSLKFDGVNDYVSCGNDSSLDITDAITVEAWVKPRIQIIPMADTYPIIAGKDNVWFFFGNGDTGNVYFKTYSSTDVVHYSYTDSILETDWYHIVGIFDGSSQKFYLNGNIQTGSSAWSGSLKSVEATNVTIGDNVATSDSWDGLIDNVRIYNRALSAEEVRYHYNRGGPVGYWNFDEGSGTTAYDSTSNNNDGTRTAGSTSGTVDSGSTTTLVDDALTQADDYWNDYTVKIVTTTDSLAPQGETATVTDFVAGTDTLSFAALTAAVGAGDTYKLYYGDENGPTWTTGKYSSAMSFDGVDDYVDCGSSSFIPTEFTVILWVKPKLYGSLDYVIHKNDDRPGIRMTDNKWWFGVDGNNGNSFSSSSTVSIGAWTHLALSFDGFTGRGYINGIEENSEINSTYTQGALLRIGWDGAAGRAFNGSIDEVRIYDYARTADEIRLDYQAGMATHLGPSGKTCSEDPAGCMDYGLVGSWGMDEGGGQYAYDASDNGNDGTLGASASSASDDPRWTTDSPPSIGGAGGGSLSFDGVDDYVDLDAYTSDFISGTGLVSFWFNGTADSAEGIWSIAGNSSDFFTIAIGNDITSTLTNELILIATWTNRIGYVTTNRAELFDGNPHHICVQSNGSAYEIYLDGNLKTLTVGLGVNNGDWSDYVETPIYTTIGALRRSDGNYWFCDGSIDGVKIYNRALSADEVRYHYNRGGPVGYWKFDEGEGSTAFDSSINRNNGTLTNFGTTDTGTSTSATDDTLTQTGKTWTVDQWADGTINITGDPGSGQTRTISSNTADTITVSSNWTTNPTTSDYSLTQAPTWTAGKYASAIQFDGKDDYVDCGNPVVTGTFTVTAWAKVLDNDANAIVGTRGPTENSFDMKFSSGSLIHGDIGNGNNWITIAADASFVYSLDTWYHIVYVVTTTGYTIYINGNEESSGSYSVDTPIFSDANHTIAIGDYKVGGTEDFNGSIDDVRIYNYARSEEQIRMDYQAGVGTHFN